MRRNFGQGPEAVTSVLTAAANVAISADHAAKVSKLQQKFQGRLDQDEIDMDFVRALLARFRSAGTRLATTTKFQPGTADFDKLLSLSMKEDMTYRGNCNVIIFEPRKAQDKAATSSRPVWAEINRQGSIKQPNRLAGDIGIIWANGCKNAHDEFRTTWISNLKESRRYSALSTHKFDAKTLDLFWKFGTGILLAIVFLIVIKFQRAVISEQEQK